MSLYSKPKNLIYSVLFLLNIHFPLLLICIVFVVRYERRKTDRKRARQQERERMRKGEEKYVFWQLGLALVVIRREGSEREREIRQNKASPRKTKAPL